MIGSGVALAPNNLGGDADGHMRFEPTRRRQRSTADPGSFRILSVRVELLRYGTRRAGALSSHDCNSARIGSSHRACPEIFRA
jgi:hypothetical protein